MPKFWFMLYFSSKYSMHLLIRDQFSLNFFIFPFNVQKFQTNKKCIHIPKKHWEEWDWRKVLYQMMATQVLYKHRLLYLQKLLQMGVSSIIKVQFGCWYVILTATTKSKVKDLSVSEVSNFQKHSFKGAPNDWGNTSVQPFARGTFVEYWLKYGEWC